MMHRFLTALVVALLFSVPLSAQANETTFAIVDVQKILEDSKAAKSVQKQVKQHREKLQDEVSKHEDELRQKEKELIDKRGSLSQEEFAKEGQAFEKELMETRKMVQKRRNSLEDALNQSLTTLRDEIGGIVTDISKERGYQIVFSEKRVIFVQNEADITAEVMKRLNQKLSKIELNIKG